MKLMIASDIHGSSFYCNKMKEAFEKEKADKLVLLGDLLYHGPRNDLTMEYDTKKVAEILNSMKEEIIAVRGNCDAEVDQMVLDFPMMSDYTTLIIDGKELFLTHGHKYNKDNLPKANHKIILIHGHTHLQTIEETEEYIYMNPGSIAIPKGENPNTYMIYENRLVQIKDLEGNEINSCQI